MTADVRHLRAFLAIAEEQSITGAAAVLRVSQPALSRTLRQLEEHLGVLLVHRTTHELRLTPAGEQLRTRAAAAVAAVASTLDPAALGSWPLRLGHAWSALGEQTTTVLRRWHEVRPDVPLQLTRVDDRLAGLGQGLVDVAVLRHRPSAADGLQTRWLRREDRVAAVATGHSLAARTTLSLVDLAQETVALNTVSGATTLDLWPEDGRPSRTRRTTNTDDWLAVIAADEAVGVTSTATADLQPFPGVAYRPLADAPALDVWLAWPSPPAHPSTAYLVELVRQVAGTGQA